MIVVSRNMADRADAVIVAVVGVTVRPKRASAVVEALLYSTRQRLSTRLVVCGQRLIAKAPGKRWGCHMLVNAAGDRAVQQHALGILRRYARVFMLDTAVECTQGRDLC